jgi:hypothetical protein
MFIPWLRVIIIYSLVIVAVSLMGKRQIGKCNRQSWFYNSALRNCRLPILDKDSRYDIQLLLFSLSFI